MISLSIKDIAQAISAQYDGRDLLVSDVSTDSREIPKGCLFLALCGDNFDGHDYINLAFEKGASFAVASNKGDYPKDKVLLVEDTRTALMQIANMVRKKTGVKVIAITGSVGKTTTKEMTARVTSQSKKTRKTPANLNNEIGLSKTILSLCADDEVAVLELGMDGPGQIAPLSQTAQPDVAIVTSIGVSHILFFGSREKIMEEKLSIRAGMPDNGVLILNGDDNLLSSFDDKRLRVLRFGIENTNCDVIAKNIKEYSTHTTFEVLYNKARFDAQIPTIGHHNVSNALAAFVAGVSVGVEPQIALAALKLYTPEGMRQKVVKHGEITVVEDCYNAGPDSMMSALKTLSRMECEGRRIAVISDMLELGELEISAHRDVGKLAAEYGIDMLFATGKLSKESVDAAKGEGQVNAWHYPDKKSLVDALFEKVKPGDIVWFKASRGMKLEEAIKMFYEK